MAHGDSVTPKHGDDIWRKVEPGNRQPRGVVTGIEPMLPRFLLMAAFDPFLALTTSDMAALKSPLAHAAASEGSVVLLAEERAANRRI